MGLRFNLSVRDYARQHDIPCQVFRRAAGGTERFQVYAAMVAIADLVVAAHYGRVGGTAFIVREAMRKGTRVVWLS